MERHNETCREAPLILLTDAVPLNGGDETLLRATTQAIRARWPDHEIVILARDAARARQLLPDLDIRDELTSPSRLLERISGRVSSPRLGEPGTDPRTRALVSSIRRLTRAMLAPMYRRLRRAFSVPYHLERLGGTRALKVAYALSGRRRRAAVRLYRSATLVASVPGGFFSDYYEVEDRLRSIELAHAYRHPVVLLAQSIGPFWRARTIRRASAVFRLVDRFCVRDSLSHSNLRAMGVHADRILDVADAAFLLRRLVPESYKPKQGPPKRIGLCFREWRGDGAAARQRTLEKAELLCRELLAEEGTTLYFISTCQGIVGYTDDSILACEVVDRLPEPLRSRCTVDRTRYNTYEYLNVLGSLDAFIGMRLHACILAMLSGTAAMGLGYEHKTEAVFGQLGFGHLQVPFSADWPEWRACLQRFMTEIDTVRFQLPAALDRICEEAERGIDCLTEYLGEPDCPTEG